MRRRVASSRDTLQAHLLPPTEYMELNFRPALGPGTSTTVTVIFFAAILLALVGGFFSLLHLENRLVGYFFNFTALLFQLFLLLLWLYSTRIPPKHLWAVVRGRALFIAAIALCALAATLSAPASTYHLLFLPSLSLVAMFAYFCGKQFAFWTTVNPQVDWPVMRRWQTIWSNLFSTKVPPECPEVRTFRFALVILIVQAWIGYELFA